MVTLQVRTHSGGLLPPAYFLDRFPIVIGRSKTADVVLEEPGVWDRHAEIILDPSAGFQVRTFPNAPSRVNGEPIVENRVLRNGDVIDVGSVKLQFWLAQAKQRDLRLREALTWIGFGMVAAGQIWLIYWLVK